MLRCVALGRQSTAVARCLGPLGCPGKVNPFQWTLIEGWLSREILNLAGRKMLRMNKS